MSVQALHDTNPAAGEQVFLRVIDPPDSAAYVVNGNDAHADDNVDPLHPKGQLAVNTPCSVLVVVPSDVVCGVTEPDGFVRGVLTVTDTYAGDNYIVQAATEPTFACGSSCAASGLITAWKQIYVEQHWMFKRGSWLTDRAAARDVDVYVRDTTAFHNGDHVVFVHAKVFPQNNTDPQDEFDAEPHTVNVIPAANGVPAHLVITDGDLSRAYVAVTGPNYFLSDAVGVANSNSAQTDDYYLPEFGPPDPQTGRTPVQELFDSMFVDLADAPTRFPIVPLFDNPSDGGPDSDARKYARRWLENVSSPGVLRPNHRAFIGAGHASVISDLGATLLPEVNVSFCYRQTIVEDVHDSRAPPLQNLNPRIVSYENAAHELLHQWRVNLAPAAAAGGDTTGHCNYNSYNDARLFCHMHQDWTDDSHNGERGDGIMKLHYVTQGVSKHSEYLIVRRTIEPMP